MTFVIREDISKRAIEAGTSATDDSISFKSEPYIKQVSYLVSPHILHRINPEKPLGQGNPITNRKAAATSRASDASTSTSDSTRSREVSESQTNRHNSTKCKPVKRQGGIDGSTPILQRLHSLRNNDIPQICRSLCVGCPRFETEIHPLCVQRTSLDSALLP